MTDAKETLRRVQDGMFYLQRGLAPFVEKNMKAVRGSEWQRPIMPAPQSAKLDVAALLKTIIAHWREVFEQGFGQERFRTRAFVALALDARNALAHHAGAIPDEDALRYLDAMHALLKLTKAPAAEIAEVKRLYDAQRHIGSMPVRASTVGSSDSIQSRIGERDRNTIGVRLLDYVRKHPDLDDDELSLRLGIKPRQTINQAARRLEADGRLTRFRGPRGKIVNRVK